MPLIDNKKPKSFSNSKSINKIYFLPSLFTTGNLFFGFLSIIRSIQAKYTVFNSFLSQSYYTDAVFLIILAFACDMIDGRIARMYGKVSLFGVEFDSIADIVSFGVAPALMVFFIILSPTKEYPFFQNIGWIIGFIYLLCSGIRLAKFNSFTNSLLEKQTKIEEDSHNYSRGLPVPVAAAMIIALVFLLKNYHLQKWSIALPFLILFIAGLMVSNILYPSFKKSNWKMKKPLQIFFIFSSIVVFIFLFIEVSFVVILLIYISCGPIRSIYCLINNFFNSKKNK